MKTLDAANYQTLAAIAKKHDELAAFYLETAQAEATAAGCTTGNESQAHSTAAFRCMNEGTEQTRKGQIILGFLAARRENQDAPAIDRKK